MKRWRILSLVILASLLLPGGNVLAVLNISDTLSTILPSTAANHDLKWSVADAGGVGEGESFTLTFASQFGTAGITFADVDIFDNGTDLSLATNCSGSEKVGFVNNGNDTFTLTICVGDGGAIASGDTVRIKIGTDATGGSNQITNPPTGSYLISMTGSGGYVDSDMTQIVIRSGITTSAYFAGPTGNLRIIGYASPGALVFFLENGSIIGNQLANGSSSFDKTLSSMDEGIHVISIYAADVDGRLTLTIAFSVSVISGGTTIVSGLILPPTISLQSSSVKRPAALSGSGRAKNYASVQVFIQGSGDSQSANIPTTDSGSWSTNFNPKLHLGNKSSYSVALDGAGGQSELSHTRLYDVLLSADLNVDNLINLTDFSVLMFNYGTSTPPNVVADINDNGPVDLVDFSVMMYYWTGG